MFKMDLPIVCVMFFIKQAAAGEFRRETIYIAPEFAGGLPDRVEEELENPPLALAPWGFYRVISDRVVDETRAMYHMTDVAVSQGMARFRSLEQCLRIMQMAQMEEERRNGQPLPTGVPPDTPASPHERDTTAEADERGERSTRNRRARRSAKQAAAKQQAEDNRRRAGETGGGSSSSSSAQPASASSAAAAAEGDSRAAHNTLPSVILNEGVSDYANSCNLAGSEVFSVVDAMHNAGFFFGPGGEICHEDEIVEMMEAEDEV